ncbi:Non-specific lipid-transfer protein 1 [Linum perenne]
MAAGQKFVTFLIIIIVGAMIAKVKADEGITCGQVVISMRPCLPYLLNGGSVPAPCCKGMTSLNDAAKTGVDRRKACECLKTAAGSIPGLNEEHAAALPEACGINLPYEFTTKTNCNS